MLRNKILTVHPQLIAWVLAFVIALSPLSAFAPTPIDSEIRDETHWYAFAVYSEIHEVAPPPHLASLTAQVIAEENWSSDTPVYYHLVNYLIAFEQVDASASPDEIWAAFFDLFNTLTNPQYVTIVTNGGWIENGGGGGLTNLQDINNTYDAVGNITQIVDASQTNTAKTTTYTYDDLHRLATAVSTNAAIGNILTMPGLAGDYQYQDTGYANPHAATVVNGQTYTYDNNGNLTGDGTWTHGWEYDKRLKQSVNGGTTVFYDYDHSSQRVKHVNGSSTTRYANKLYNTDSTKNVKHIYAGSQLVATLENTTMQYIHTDHLTGSNVATNNSGTLIQLLDYYPYGSMRIDQSSTFDEQRKYENLEVIKERTFSLLN